MILSTDNLTKIYSTKKGCFDIDIEIPSPQIFGLLGPNGAGKSTLVKMLVGLLIPTYGNAYILDKSIRDVDSRKYIGYLPENFKLHDWLTGYEVLEYHSRLLGIKQNKNLIYDLLHLVGLFEHRDFKVKNYSKGMQQRLGIAVALIGEPKIVFFDEPTSALDPIGRIEVRNIILKLRNNGITVFLNSHLLSEVEKICDSIAIINKGKVIAKGKIEDFTNNNIKIYAKVSNINENLIDYLNNQQYKFSVQNQNIIEIFVKNNEEIPKISKVLANQTELYELKKEEQLEDIFIKLLGEENILNGNNN